MLSRAKKLFFSRVYLNITTAKHYQTLPLAITLKCLRFLFLIFDIETIFLYPFAVYLNSLGLFAIIEAFVFISILLVGLFIAIREKMLRWI